MKKHSILILLLMFSLSAAIFAAENINLEQYDSLIAAYKQGPNYFKRLMGSADDIKSNRQIIEAHKQMLEERKQAIESSYMPLLTNFIATTLAASSIGMGYYAVQGATASQALFNQLPKISLFDTTYNFGLGFFDYIKYSAKKAMGLKNNIVSGAQNEVTQYLLQSPNQQKVIEEGVAAIPLGVGSLVSVALSMYLFKKAARYKEELAQIEENIKRDNGMLKILEK